jgi:hypothetical protein
MDMAFTDADSLALMVATGIDMTIGALWYGPRFGGGG